jgi:glycosyltransferase involved in cell wall biosynthesis
MTGRVLFVDETAQIGGAEVLLATIARHLRRRGWEATVVLPEDGPLHDLLAQAEVPVACVPGFPFLSSSFYLGQRHKLPNPFALFVNALLGSLWVLRLRRAFRRRRPTVVHTMSMWSHVFAGLAGRLAGCSVVWHFQEIMSPSSGFGLYRRVLLWWAQRVPKHIICISNKVARQFAGGGVDPNRVDILWNTIDTETFAPAQGGAPIEGDGRPLTIGTAARFVRWKGHDVALRAARELKSRSVPFEWRFAGGEALGAPGYRAHLMDRVAEWGLEDEVRFVGWVDDMPTFYGSLDVLVHVPTEPEPFGLVPAEALAAGLPVVAASGGGIDDMIRAGGGILVPPDQAEPLVEALIGLEKSPGEVERRGEAARHFAERTFSVDAYIKQLTEIYRRCQE